MQNLKTNIIDNYEIAQYLKFRLQDKNPHIENTIPLRVIKAKSFYQKNKKQIDNIIQIQTKYNNFNIYKYIDFFVDEIYNFKDQLSNFYDKYSLIKYRDYLNYEKKQDRIYSYFLKSIKNIVNDCKQLNIFSAKDYLRYLINNKKLSQYYISGKISCYFFAAIPKFKLLIEKLDKFERNDLNDIYTKYEMYNTEIVKIFMKKTNKKVNPLDLIDQLLKK